jgi:tRNA 5-methylaminomethyl-2-thiouridine biosynthesis bifunctional protein
MKTAPIVAAEVDFTGDAPSSPMYGDLYHPREDALAQARDVFIAGNGLPQRWQDQPRFTILEAGFGLGNNFLATWAAWRDDPARCARLHFFSLEQHPLTKADFARAHAHSPLRALADQLRAQWPSHTPNLHSLSFDAGRVQLLLGYGDAATLAREIVAQVNAFYLDGFAPAHNATMWSPALFTALARLAAHDASVATWSAARVVREGLASVGFAVQAAQGPGRKRDITLARYAPRHVAPRAPGRQLPQSPPQHAVIVGAGLAGAAAARALSQAGVPCTVFERAPLAASGASGNPAGLFHSTIGRDDGLHHRLHRGASFAAARWLRDAGGEPSGLLRLHDDADAVRGIVDAQRLPPDHVRPLDRDAASALAGVPLAGPAWHFVDGGFADPALLVRHALALPGVHFCPATGVRRIEAHADGWRVFGDEGQLLADTSLVVLAASHDALPLAGLPPHWLSRTRGQVSWLPVSALRIAPPRLPVASGGYALTLQDVPGGRLLLGATQQPGDDDPALRAEDHAHNLARAAALFGLPSLLCDEHAHIEGRVGWRAVTRDRLPIVGAAPDLATKSTRHGSRFVPRRAGLFVLTGLGSRGLTTAALCGELIAAQATGAPWPLEADLVDAIDPARFVV